MEKHLRSLFLTQLVTDAVLEEAAGLLDRHPLRAYDAVQLAGCKILQSSLGEPVAFVCSDHQLLRAAESEGLQVVNPAGD
jgi:predicted nucleic acid-binding protein